MAGSSGHSEQGRVQASTIMTNENVGSDPREKERQRMLLRRRPSFE